MPGAARAMWRNRKVRIGRWLFSLIWIEQQQDRIPDAIEHVPILDTLYQREVENLTIKSLCRIQVIDI